MTEKTHPAEEELFELLIGQLHGSRGKEVSRHLEGCEDCFGYLKDFEKITTAFEKFTLDGPSPTTLKAVSHLARFVRPPKQVPWIRSLIFSKALSLTMISFVVAGIAVYFKDHYYQQRKDFPLRVAETPGEKSELSDKIEKPALPDDDQEESKDEGSDGVVMTGTVSPADQDKPGPVTVETPEKKETAPRVALPAEEKIAVRELEVPSEKTVSVQTTSKQYERAPSPASGFKRESSPSLNRQNQQEAVSYKTAGLTTSGSEDENPDVLMTKAMTHEQKGEYAQAEEIYRTIEEKHPQFAKRDLIVKRRARMLEKLGRRGEARELRQRFKDSSRQNREVKPGKRDFPRDRQIEKDFPRQSPDLKRSRPPGGNPPGGKPPGGGPRNGGPPGGGGPHRR